MGDYDEGSVFYSYQNRESGSAAAGSGSRRAGVLTAVEAKRRFKAFILGFTNAKYTYVYREGLRRVGPANKYALEVRVEDLAGFDPALAAALRESPSELMPQVTCYS